VPRTKEDGTGGLGNGMNSIALRTISSKRKGTLDLLPETWAKCRKAPRLGPVRSGDADGPLGRRGEGCGFVRPRYRRSVTRRQERPEGDVAARKPGASLLSYPLSSPACSWNPSRTRGRQTSRNVPSRKSCPGFHQTPPELPRDEVTERATRPSGNTGGWI